MKISEIKRKSLPAIAKTLGLENEQGLHHFLTDSPWSAKELEKRRLELILKILEGEAIEAIIDETGDKKAGKTTDYVKRQYIGNLSRKFPCQLRQLEYNQYINDYLAKKSNLVEN